MEFLASLKCCGASRPIQVDEKGVRAELPNEVRKNVLCPSCGKIVILTFSINGAVKITEQEVIRFD